MGRLRKNYLGQGVGDYQKRLAAYVRFSIVEVKEEPFSKPLHPHKREGVLQREGERLLARLSPRSFVCALDRRGQQLSSPELAAFLQELAVRGPGQIDFIIGGSLGLAPFVLKRADLLLSFSKFTFPHQLMRLILLEQIYRAFTLLRGESYHK